MKTFLRIHQNNSGGQFMPPAVNLFIEADNRTEAIRLAEQHIEFCCNDGSYAAYDECGCCPCCGHRWDIPWADEEPKPNGYDWIDQTYDFVGWHGKPSLDLNHMGGTNYALIKKDGSIVVGKTKENQEEIIKFINPNMKVGEEVG